MIIEAVIFDAANGEGVVGPECGKKFGDKIGAHGIVCIDKTDIFAGGFFEAGIAGGGLALVFLRDDRETRVFFSIFLEDLGCGVRGAIIYDQDFEIMVSLGEDGIETFGKVIFGIVGWDDNGN